MHSIMPYTQIREPTVLSFLCLIIWPAGWSGPHVSGIPTMHLRPPPLLVSMYFEPWPRIHTTSIRFLLNRNTESSVTPTKPTECCFAYGFPVKSWELCVRNACQSAAGSSVASPSPPRLFACPGEPTYMNQARSKSKISKFSDSATKQVHIKHYDLWTKILVRFRVFCDLKIHEIY